MTDYKKQLETMCERCINHEMCQGTGCSPKNELQKLVELATPKKPKYSAEADIYGCPNCDYGDMMWGTFQKTNCCPSCGQVIDWSETDE